MHKHLNVKTFFLAVLFLNAFYTTAYSQSPTKEQTIEFLKSHYENKGEMICSDDRYPESVSNSFKLTSIKDLGNCEYQLVYEWNYDYRNDRENLKNSSYSKYTILINFSKVESLSYYTTKKGDCELYYINFKGVPGVEFKVTEESLSFGAKETKTYSKNEVIIPANKQGNSDVISEETKKIRKAFNHLRKLCGAPDPIEF